VLQIFFSPFFALGDCISLSKSEREYMVVGGQAQKMLIKAKKLSDHDFDRVFYR
jgi:hypothetical protein